MCTTGEKARELILFIFLSWNLKEQYLLFGRPVGLQRELGFGSLGFKLGGGCRSEKYFPPPALDHITFFPPPFFLAPYLILFWPFSGKRMEVRRYHSFPFSCLFPIFGRRRKIPPKNIGFTCCCAYDFMGSLRTFLN